MTFRSSATVGERGLTRVERSLFAVVLALTALAGVGRHVSGIPHVVAFILAALALAGLAWTVSFSTEQIGMRYGPALTGTLQSTVGNLPEFFVVIFALQAHDTTVAETALIGSILVNALLVLGMVLIAGARQAPDGVMRFSQRLPNDTATLLLASSLTIVLVGVVTSSHRPAAITSRRSRLSARPFCWSSTRSGCVATSAPINHRRRRSQTRRRQDRAQSRHASS